MNAAALRKMLDLGLTLEQAVELAEVWEAGSAAPVPALSKAALRTRKWREKNAEASPGDVTVTHHGDASTVTVPPLPLPSSPQTPQQPTPTPPDINTRTRGPKFAKSNGFARFWEAYPNKVGKAAAEKAYARAIGKIAGPDPPGELLAGVERAKASREWSEGYIPHPTTWLNQGRWEDQPAEITPAPKVPHERPHHDAKFNARQASLATFERGADLAARLHREP